jgi:hypothetical protein
MGGVALRFSREVQAFAGSRIGVDLLALPLCGAAVTFFSAAKNGFRRIPFSFWFISVAPVRGGSHFLCCCKESNQRKQLVRHAVTRSLAMLAM